MGRAANPHILQGVYQVMDMERYISVCSGVIKPGQSDAIQQSAKISTRLFAAGYIFTMVPHLQCPSQ